MNEHEHGAAEAPPRRALRFACAALLALSACQAPSGADPAPSESPIAPPTSASATARALPPFEPGPPPRAALFVVAYGAQFARFERSPDAALLLYGDAIYELRGDALVRRADLEKQAAEHGAHPGLVATSRWKHGSTLSFGRAELRLTSPFVFTVHGSTDTPPIVTKRSEFLLYKDMSALESGEIFALADERVERWPAAGTASVVDKVPTRKGHSEPELEVVFARSPREVWAGGWDFEGDAQLPYLARFDGTTWSAQRCPGAGAIGAIAGGPDGALWYAARGLHRLGRGDDPDWLLPRSLEVSAGSEWVPRGGLLVVGPNDVWVVVRAEGRALIVHSRPGSGVLNLDDGTAMTFAQAATRWWLPPAAAD